jgi:hypothetical protein
VSAVHETPPTAVRRQPRLMTGMPRPLQMKAVCWLWLKLRAHVFLCRVLGLRVFVSVCWALHSDSCHSSLSCSLRTPASVARFRAGFAARPRRWLRHRQHLECSSTPGRFPLQYSEVAPKYFEGTLPALCALCLHMFICIQLPCRSYIQECGYIDTCMHACMHT